MTIIYSKVIFFIDFCDLYICGIFCLYHFLQYNVYISNRYLNSDDLSIDMTT